MRVQADPLRNTLDHLALDPRAKDDRKYLVSMLRRLGYTETEIEEALGPEPETRIIEVEYRKGRADTTDFSVVEDGVGFSVTEGRVGAAGGDPAIMHGWIADDGDTAARGADVDNPWIEEAPEPWDDVVEFEERAPAETLDWEAEPWDESEPAADEPAQASDEPWVQDDEPWVQDTDEAPAQEAAEPWAPEPEEDAEESAEWDAGDWPEDGETLSETPEDAWAPVEETPSETPEDAWASVEEPQTVEFEENDDIWAPAETEWQAEPAEDAVEESWDEAEYEITDAPAGAWEPEAFSYGEYDLYTRTVELSTGREQQIYFFAKNEPKSGERCAMPEGYIVEENERTGLPFLRRETANTETERCAATTQAGAQCKKSAMDGSDFCNVHQA